MNTEPERAEFEAWMRDNHPGHCLIFVNGYLHKWPQRLWEAYQAGRAALQSQSMPPEISRDLLGKIVDEVFDGAIEDAGVIEDIYRVVARECALQSQDREDALRYRWLRDSALLFSQIEQPGVSGWMVGRRDHVKTRFYTYNGKELDEAIDRARRIEGQS